MPKNAFTVFQSGEGVMFAPEDRKIQTQRPGMASGIGYVGFVVF
jgi:hypothetical protein